MQYQEIINSVCTNDATVKAVAVCLTLISWFKGACNDAIESGQIVRCWWENHGKIYATMAALLAVVAFCAVSVVATATYNWLKDYGIPGAIQGLDILCAALLCYEEPELEAADFSVPELDLSEGEALINWAFSLKQ
ncbi:hypothetical protein D0962_21330 [Leptolyngbyaceae cyanobacterium CCMR0082]|uniref:Uncharacterized protein n=1 Tax=Adonisia turfae CCMR0082 TaxID=2304604 RepID=A0A6M0SC92_9CYAN|nr:hypothetical protein [Adonisia turfae]NEZ65282.1 hypothetical protein [Adonisia turfae CCMR0082]